MNTDELAEASHTAAGRSDACSQTKIHSLFRTILSAAHTYNWLFLTLFSQQVNFTVCYKCV